MMHYREMVALSPLPKIPLSHLFVSWDLFGELLGLLLSLRAELLCLVDGGVGALFGLVSGLVELVLDSGKAVLGLELESLLTATHAVDC